MKRDHNHIQSAPPTPAMAAGKMKSWEDEEQDSGMDELLAVLGYKVKTADMAGVAQKIEKLEEALGSVVYDDYNSYNSNCLSTLVSDNVVYYNPSDISNCLESMLSGLDPNPNAADPITDLPVVFNRSSSDVQAPTPIVYESFISPAESSSINFANSYDDLCFDCDLKAIPGKAIFAQPKHEPISNSVSNSNMYTNANKKLKRTAGQWGIVSTSSNDASTSLATRPVLVDSEETGVRLVHTLRACGHAIQSNNLKLAETLVKQIRHLAPLQAGAMGKVATFFAEAIARKIYRYNPRENLDPSILHMHFYESCPYLKFAHFTANQAILEAFSGKERVHVIDFSMNQGQQWPALMQALATRSGGPPAFRLTGIGPPSSDKTDKLQEVGWKLAQFAETIKVEFEYRGFVANSLADLDSSMLDLRPSETESVAVNSVFELHSLLARPGAIDKVLNVVKEMKPEIVTIVEQEANHNSPIFSERFNESLDYYSTLFDSLDGCVINENKIMSEVYLGRQICNLVACEGSERVERHEPLTQWQNRFDESGFESVHLGSNSFKMASMMLAFHGGGDGYRVEEKDGCLMLCWHTRPLITTSAWQVCATQ